MRFLVGLDLLLLLLYWFRILLYKLKSNYCVRLRFFHLTIHFTGPKITGPKHAPSLPRSQSGPGGSAHAMAIFKLFSAFFSTRLLFQSVFAYVFAEHFHKSTNNKLWLFACLNIFGSSSTLQRLACEYGKLHWGNDILTSIWYFQHNLLLSLPQH